MKKLPIPFLLLLLISLHIIAQSTSTNPKPFMVRHTVVFKLKFPKGSAEESQFLNAVAKLSSIPGVNKFETLRQTSKQSDFEYGVSMEFDSQKAYEAYSQHPDHTKFVETYWGKYVDKFLEIDYEPMK